MAQLKSTTIYGDLRVIGTTTFNEDLYSSSIYLEEDANSSYYLRLLNNSGLTANKTLTINTNNTDRTISLSGDVTSNVAFTAGATSTYTGAITVRSAGTSATTITGPNGGEAVLSAGTMAITGGKLSQFAATTSAELAGVISDETGSGALVFGTSPTFTTSIKIYDTDSTTYAYTISPSNISGNITITLPTTSGAYFAVTDQSTGKVNLGSTTYVTGTLPVGNGGTGATTFTANAILVGNTTAAISAPGPTLSSTTMTFGGAGTVTSAAASAMSVTAGTTGKLTLDSGTTGGIDIGVNANAKAITIGNTTGATGVTVNTGTNGVIFNQVAAGIFKVQASAAPTTDIVQITNTGYGTTTAGVNGLSVTYVGGAAAVEASAIRVDITPGGTTGGIWNTLKVASTAAAASGVTMNVLKVDDKTTGAGTSNVFYIGTGYDYILNYNGTSVIDGTGKVIAGQLSGTIPSAVLGNSTVYIGSTAVGLNRSTGSLALTGISSIDGSAATLTTTRTIWGQNFNGSAAVSGSLSSVGPSITFTNTAANDISTTASANGTVGRALTIGAGSTTAGTSNIVGGNLIIQSGAGTGTGASSILFNTGTTLTSGTTLQTISTKMTILGSGNVGIGPTAPAEKLHIEGDFRIDDASGNDGFKMVYDNTAKSLQFNYVGA